jgi:radical SAM superfamily enzyme YgiQ (UPF0313 family)
MPNYADDTLLLVKPPYNYYPMGLAYVASTMERSGFKYEYVDALTSNEDLVKRILDRRYYAVATGGLVNDLNYIEGLVKRIKIAAPETITIVGGHITKDVAPATLFDNMPLDFAVYGEAEVTFPLLLDKIRSGNTNYSDLNGLIWRNHAGKATKNRPQKRIDFRIDRVMPSFNFFDHATWPIHQRPIPIITGRGCPGVCVFCSPSSHTFIPRLFDDILTEAETIVNSFGAKNLTFLNEVMFYEDQMIIDFCKEYKRRLPNIPFSTVLRIDMNLRTLAHLKDAGCYAINIGVESGSDAVLTRMSKQINTQQIRAFVHEAKRVGIFSIVSGFLFGNEDETEKDMEATLVLEAELNIQSGFAITVPYPGTTLYRRAASRGLITDEYDFLKSLQRCYDHEFLSEVIFTRRRDGGFLLPNTSAIQDDLYRDTLRQMLARYNQRYALKNPGFSVRDGKAFMKGDCPVCGAANEIEFDLRNPLARGLSCPNTGSAKCGNCVSFHAHIHELESVRHYVKVSRPLIERRKVAFVGRPFNIKYLMELDTFGVKIDDIICVSLLQNQQQYVYGDNYGNITPNTRHVPIDTLIALKPEIIVVAEMPPASLIIRDTLITKGYPAECVVLMCQPDAVPYLDLIHYWHAVPALPRSAKVVVWPIDDRVDSAIYAGRLHRDQIVAFVDADWAGDKKAGGAAKVFKGKPVLHLADLETIGYDTILGVAPEQQEAILAWTKMECGGPIRQEKDMFLIAEAGNLHYIFGRNIFRLADW